MHKVKYNILKSWDAATKKFKKPDGITEQEFNAIKKAARKVKAGTIATWAAIGGLAVSALYAVSKKVLNSKKNV